MSHGHLLTRICLYLTVWLFRGQEPQGDLASPAATGASVILQPVRLRSNVQMGLLNSNDIAGRSGSIGHQL
ncbi:hypothetical protein BO94DRAFT_351851 [Aspergillus sclerotioniger CBS 115572]|uniref:Uncharacterized protein n=1 Tax=Aspergillus sclerotioniger CBS 115572 TaxID=1450535 RepID=A0A317X635_9EURO|nr:hypothetical protein BO94DRAFT_351851 [Aspergillus sclerotioniger CBS 115572]PWY93765.1 hypothetical protein BO94DRAFT_351851 [Aspergillus sclerotioniger CBS 115572]